MAATRRVAIIVPVLARPQNVAFLMDSVAAGEIPCRLLFVASPGDRAELKELGRRNADFLVAPWHAGPADFARKVNLGYRETREQWLFPCGDDVAFCPDWATKALAVAAATGKRVIGTDDLGNERVKRGELATHPLFHRGYVDRLGTADGPGQVYAECYDHNFVDHEAVETAKARGEWAFAPLSHVEHCHPNWGKGRMDRTYQKGQRRFAEDRALFQRRRRLWS